MARYPDSTKTSLEQRMRARARERWPQIAGLQIRHRGNFSYIDATLTDTTTLKLCRLRYVGSASQWQFAIYRASHDDYDESVFPTGLPVGTCQDAVIAVITAGALVAGLTAAHKPAAPKPAVSGSAPAGLPRFYVTTSSGPGGRGIQAVVRGSASGKVTGTVPVPSAIPVEWADSGGTFVTAAADDRSFIIGVQGGQGPTKTGLDLRLFRFAISAAGKPGHLTELAAAPMRNETTEGIALSPDGKLLAVSLMSDSTADAVGAIQVIDLATGATRTWTAPAHSVYIPGPPSWADGSRVIAFTWLRSTQSGLMSAPRGIRLLDTAAPGDNLMAGTVIVPGGMVAAGSIVSALITPDGRDVIVVTWRDLTPQASTHTVVVQFAELQAATGRLVRLLYTRTERYDGVPFTTLQDSLGVLSLGSQGRYALVQGIQFGWLDVGGPDLGRFTPLPAVPVGQYVNFAAW